MRARRRLYRHENGAPAWEIGYDARGRMHGVEREWYASGQRLYRVLWRHGLPTGLAEQWDERGRRILSTRFVAGTGLDLWHCGFGLFTETWLVRGLPHGPERDWVGATRVTSERWFAAGLRHGIEREWNGAGKLARGFPRYWVAGERVDRRTYSRARHTDATLPAIDAKDDRPRRTPPPELVRAAAQARGTRR